MGRVGHGPPEIMIGWATMRLAHPIIGCMFVSCSSVKLVKKQICVAITVCRGFCDKLPADRIFAGIISQSLNSKFTQSSLLVV